MRHSLQTAPFSAFAKQKHQRYIESQFWKIISLQKKYKSQPF